MILFLSANIAFILNIDTFIYYPVKSVGLATPSTLKGKLQCAPFFPFIDEGVDFPFGAHTAKQDGVVEKGHVPMSG